MIFVAFFLLLSLLLFYIFIDVVLPLLLLIFILILICIFIMYISRWGCKMVVVIYRYIYDYIHRWEDTYRKHMLVNLIGFLIKFTSVIEQIPSQTCKMSFFYTTRFLSLKCLPLKMRDFWQHKIRDNAAYMTKYNNIK